MNSCNSIQRPLTRRGRHYVTPPVCTRSDPAQDYVTPPVYTRSDPAQDAAAEAASPEARIFPAASHHLFMRNVNFVTLVKMARVTVDASRGVWGVRHSGCVRVPAAMWVGWVRPRFSRPNLTPGRIALPAHGWGLGPTCNFGGSWYASVCVSVNTTIRKSKGGFI